MDKIVESVPTEFDYFEPKNIQAAVTNEFVQWFQPPTLQPGAPIEFEIKGSDNLYLDLNNSKLEIRARIVNSDKTNIGADAAISPANLALHSMFSSIEMEMSGKTITNQNTLYPYRAFLETMLSYGKEVAKTRLLTEGWMKDTAGHMDDFRIEDAGANIGAKDRAAIWAGSRTVTLLGRPHLDLFHQNLDIPPGCNIRLRLFPSKVNFLLKKPAALADDFLFEIVEARLWIRMKEVSPSFLLAQETMLHRSNARIPFTKVEMKTITIGQGLSSKEMDNIYSGILPERVTLALIGDNRLNGSANHNPFYFENFDLFHVAMLVNGEQVPRVAYQPNFVTRDYLREYFGLLEGLGLDTGNHSIDLSPSEWANTFPIFIFRLSPGGFPSIPRAGSVRLDLKFRNPTPQNIIAILYSEVPTILEIDKDRNITVA